MDHDQRKQNNRIAQWAFDTRPILGRFHLWLEDVDVEWLRGDHHSDLNDVISFVDAGMERLLTMAMAVTALGTKLFGRYGEGEGLDKNAMSLSGGQQQRLVIARAIAIEPEVLLLDEPASALDPISTLKIEELIYELKSRYTIVIVTHNMQQAARVSDYTAYMYIGELIEFNDTNTLFTKPLKKKTEDYITGRHG